jgi:hypothetical protein
MKKFISLLLLFIPVILTATPTALTVTKLSETSANIPWENADNANGNSALNNNGDVFFLFKNGSGVSTATVTITAQSAAPSVSGYGPLTKSNVTVSLAASGEEMVGPFNALVWNNSSDQIIVSYAGDASADVDVAALRAVKY